MHLNNELAIERLIARLETLQAAPPVTVTAIRHGQSTLNAAGLFTGQLDPPLTPWGRRQAGTLRQSLADSHWDRCLHSGARRARDTLQIALRTEAGPAAEPRTDTRLRERFYGSLEGTPSTGWEQPPDIDAAPPGGESYRELGIRVLDALADLLAEAEAEQRPLNVLVCAHSGVLRVLRSVETRAQDMALLLGPGPSTGQAMDLRYVEVEMPSVFADLT